MRYKANIEYDGSKYYGFQRLKKEKTVQKELENAISKINKQKTEIKGAGRTDRNAHALDQVIHFDLMHDIPNKRLKNALNSLLESSIYIKKIEKASNTFHSRFNAKEKTYKYIINLGKYNPFLDGYVYNYNKKLNINKMKKASKYLIGSYSFKAYVTGYRKNYDTSIYKISFKKKEETLTIIFKGGTFYNHMVRNMVGALILVGENKIKPIHIKEMLLRKDNIYDYATVPANGLYLVNIKY